MTYREVPAWLATDADPTVLLDGAKMTPESVTASGGTWTALTDDEAVEVRLAWTDRLFVHASAAVADADDRLALELDQSAVPGTNDADARDADSPDVNASAAEPVFTPESDRHEFEVRLVADDSADDDRPDSDRRER
jgi:hypothetical protein